MTSVDYSNQTDIFNPERFTWPVHIIGLGGIGGSLLFPLVKLGIGEVHLWDDDVVVPHNLPSQLIYRPSDVGQPKVVAAQAFLERQESGCVVQTHAVRVGPETTLQGIVISGVDSMASRKAIWQVVRFSFEIPLYLDGRIGGERLQLLSCRPSDVDGIERYERTLFSDDEASPLPCAARAVIHPVVTLAGLIITQLTLFARNEEVRPNIMAHLQSLQFV